MSSMSDQPLTLSALADFYREVMRPDFSAILGASEARLGAEMRRLHDVVIYRLDRIEDELQSIRARLEAMDGRLDLHESGYQDLIAAIYRLEERLSLVERRLDELVDGQVTLRAEVAELRARLESLEMRLRNRQGS